MFRASALLLVLLGAACRDTSSNSFTTPASAMQTQPERQSALTGSRRTAIVEAVGRVAPSVVSIRAQVRRQVTEGPSFFDFFVPRQQVFESFGTGFVFRADGHIITNQHVVASAQAVTVSLPDGTDLEARVVGEDPTTDIAVLKVERRDLPLPTLGQSRDLMVGEWVVALGNPYTYLLGNAEPTVTAGVVSATGRNILPSRDQAGMYLDMIQTDAPINPGNSGGPLANALGQVIGVNSSIFGRSGESIGLGFAIPIERALRVADEIIKSGSVRRAWTGLEVAGAGNMREWKRSGGVQVTRVAPGGPAARAGIREGAVLVQANGRPLRNFLDWEAVKLDLHVGDVIEFLQRDGSRTVARRVVTGDLPTVTAEKVNVLRGLELVTVTPAVRSERGIQSEGGALVFRTTGEVTRATGLAEGDVIIGINRTRVTNAQQVASLLDAVRPRESFRIYFERGGQVGYTDLAFR
ncbi:MAG TPA: trypsin-like peptidase domain-containing protein [Gemmatimonadales bacterium]